MARILAAHQPNFCPWRPFFQKIEQCDVFVLLGHVQFSSGVYQNRFKINEAWSTMSVERNTRLIKDKQYVKPQGDWTRIKKAFPKLSVFDYCISGSLWYTNTSIIVHAAMLFDIHVKKILHDHETHLSGTDRLIDLCKTYGCDTYLSGISGKLYLTEESFKMAGIKLIYQDESTMDKRPLVEML